MRKIDWSVQTGACAGILGPNGSGKSTLTRIIGGHLWPTAGQVTILGQRFGQTNLPQLRERIRLVQAAGPYDVDPALSVHQVVQTGFFGTIGLYDPVTDARQAEAQRVVNQVGLARVADHPYSTLSSGERVRALIGRALMARPELLLLDEPTAGLDLLAREQVLATIEGVIQGSASGGPAAWRPTVLMITHHVEELPPSTSQLLLLDDGTAAASGRPDQVLRGEILSKVYHCPVEVTQRDGRYSLYVHPSAWAGLLHREAGE